MYLHLGQNTVRQSEIVGIFRYGYRHDFQKIPGSFCRCEKGGRVFNVSMELPKSFVVCTDAEGNETVYISQISSSTLLKRTAFMDTLTFSE